MPALTKRDSSLSGPVEKETLICKDIHFRGGGGGITEVLTIVIHDRGLSPTELVKVWAHTNRNSPVPSQLLSIFEHIQRDENSQHARVRVVIRVL